MTATALVGKLDEALRICGDRALAAHRTEGA
jgi:hypothetical protein